MQRRFARHIQLALLAAAVLLGLILYYVLEEVARIAGWSGQALQFEALLSWNLRWTWLVAIGVALLAWLIARSQKRVVDFIDEVFIEFSKVTWSTRKEVMASTGVVLVMLVLATTILSIFNWIWGTLSAQFLRPDVVPSVKGPS